MIFITMNIVENIIRIQEIINNGSSDETKDLSPVIEKLLRTTLIPQHSDIICDVKVTHPDNRDVLEGQPKYTSYKILFFFIGGYGTKYWPHTQAVASKYEKIMDDAWDLVYNFLNIPTDLYSTLVKSCD